jgi:choline dehydrogenase-like flavoprotein
MVLSQAGANVVMLEAGPMWDSATDSAMFKWPYDTPRRGAAIPERQFGEFDAALGGWTLEGEPYTSAPGNQFDWFRSRMLGGRTNHWGRISLRFGPHDFQRKSLDSLGDDWPISYDEREAVLRQDRSIHRRLRHEPAELSQRAGRVFLPPPEPRCYELLIKQASEKLNIPSVPSRLSILTKPLNGPTGVPLLLAVRPRLRDPLEFLVPIGTDSAGAEDRPTEDVPSAMAREITVDDTGLANGVTYVDKATARDNHVRARIVVVAGGACESARLLLNSKSSRFPQGLANSSGTVGKYLMDSTGASVTGFIPKLMDGTPHNEDGVGGMHLYTPWWLDNKKLDFPRGYHIELGGGRRMPNAGFGSGIHNFTSVEVAGQPHAFGGYGKGLKDDYRRLYGATVNFAGPRRNDPEPRQLLRDRSDGRRQMGHPGASVSLQVERLRVEPGEAHAGNLPRDRPGNGRDADLADAVEGRWIRDRRRRPHHSRGWCDADGEQSVDVRAEQELPGARRQERVRRRRRPAAVAGRQELHVDDSRAVDAHG